MKRAFRLSEDHKPHPQVRRQTYIGPALPDDKCGGTMRPRQNGTVRCPSKLKSDLGHTFLSAGLPRRDREGECRRGLCAVGACAGEARSW
jgi:hypothetical protein